MASEELIRAAVKALENGLKGVLLEARGQPYEAQILELVQGLTTRATANEGDRAESDPIRAAHSTFDTANPRVAARTAALALLGQPLKPLCNIEPEDGSGIFAIYYTGTHPLYESISNSETPIYIGKVDPAIDDASTAQEQGDRLTRRLSELARSIAAAEAYSSANTPHGETIKLADFHYRRLVCANSAQLVGERYLIKLFWPLWNTETKACWGLGKHGDSAGMRRNKRSPWDIAHPGRPWALVQSLTGSLTLDEIRDRIAITLKKCPARRDRTALHQELLDSLRPDNLTLAQASTPPVEAANGSAQIEANGAGD